MASKELIEKVAKAIYESRNGAGRTPWSQLPWSHKVPYMDDAEAARKSFFAALHEPTEGMVNAVFDDGNGSIKDDWQTALNASPLAE